MFRDALSFLMDGRYQLAQILHHITQPVTWSHDTSTPPVSTELLYYFNHESWIDYHLILFFLKILRLNFRNMG